MAALRQSNIDVATEHDYWQLQEGSYELVVGLRRVGTNDGTVGIVRSIVHVHSKADARYLFNTFTDMKRKVRKMSKLQQRLFS